MGGDIALRPASQPQRPPTIYSLAAENTSLLPRGSRRRMSRVETSDSRAPGGDFVPE
jgi:hypothetical protein